MGADFPSHKGRVGRERNTSGLGGRDDSVRPGEVAKVAQRRLPVDIRRHHLELGVCARDREEDRRIGR